MSPRLHNLRTRTANIHPVAAILAGTVRILTGVQARWSGIAPETIQRIYFANHTSHLDFVVLWASLPGIVRAHTRPVAARDYWKSGIRAYLAREVFRAILIDRKPPTPEPQPNADPHAYAQHAIQQMVSAIGVTESLILFPEGTRGDGTIIAPFRAGLYHLALARPDVELVPVYLENLSRILPKGEVLPVPLIGMLTFGPPLHLQPGEPKQAFLDRTRNAILALGRKPTP